MVPRTHSSTSSSNFSRPSSSVKSTSSAARYWKIPHDAQGMVMCSYQLLPVDPSLPQPEGERVQRVVLAASGPDKGCPSARVIPPSRGRARMVPRIFLAITGVPFARARSTISCATMSGWTRGIPKLVSAELGVATFAWILFRAQGRPLPGQRRYVAHRQRRSDADRLDTVVDPVKRHSLDGRWKYSWKRMTRRSGIAY
jgi:hypothetical protein